ncbi:prolyl oligopeptidase family serine peptidase [Candidatus Gottesmanbacteria bacterium]|nr:prolyl oligopeptidase family serine peptidase [Candidatus Gottesmanbacteria bacterium]
MKKIIIICVILIFIVTAAIFLFFTKSNSNKLLSPINKITEKPLEKYGFEKLKNRIPAGGNIEIGEQQKKENSFSSHIFYFTTEGKKVSGMMNIPTKPGKYPVLILLRGFIDQQIYTTGDGTRRDGEIFAQNGFITLAPDFLGYGESASPSANPVEERFQTYTTTLDLLSSINNINQSLSTLNGNIIADTQKVGIWGHSNGGQIALSVLTITGKNYPTVLWAPVSKPFPYSVLYYTDEFDDHGKKLRKVIADFEIDYDSELYTFTNYLDWINAPIQLNQGTTDEEVPQRWSDRLVKELKDKQKEITYFTYPGEDHNFTKGDWSNIIARNIAFYQKVFATH